VVLLPAVAMTIVPLVQSSDLGLPGLVLHPTAIRGTIASVAPGLPDRVALENNGRSAALTAGWLGVVALLALGCGLARALAARMRGRAGRELGAGTSTAAVPLSSTQRGPGLAASDRDVLVAACVDLADAVPSEALRRRLLEALSQAGVRSIEVDEGCAFDPGSACVVEGC